MCESTERAELLLPLTPTAVRTARHFTRDSSCSEHALGRADEAVLLISELVTNAIRHGGPPVVVTIDCTGCGLHVRVRDGSRVLPQQRRAGDDDEGGRGLFLTDALSSAWGVEQVDDEHGVGKAVWFDLH